MSKTSVSAPALAIDDTADLDIQKYIEDALERVEDELYKLVENVDPELNLRLTYLAKAGGKRLRPALVALTSCLGFEGADAGLHPADPAKVTSAGALVELTHLASLYHDDVMDEAPLRRGTPSAQRVFGNSQAILAGDLLFARASTAAVALGLEVVDLHAQTFARLCAGQLHETIGPKPGADKIAHHYQVLADKTGSLIAAAARYGAMLTGANLELQLALATYGEKLGVAFQLADDVIDLSADPAQTGKTPGTDLREGVATMPLLLLENAEMAGKLSSAEQQFLTAYRTGDLTDDAFLADLVAQLRQLPVVEKTQVLARQWAAEAVEALTLLPSGQVKEALTDFADQMVSRVA